MNGNRLLYAMGDIAGRYVIEAEPRPMRRTIRIGVRVLAACLAFALIGTAALRMQGDIGYVLSPIEMHNSVPGVNDSGCPGCLQCLKYATERDYQAAMDIPDQGKLPILEISGPSWTVTSFYESALPMIEKLEALTEEHFGASEEKVKFTEEYNPATGMEEGYEYWMSLESESYRLWVESKVRAGNGYQTFSLNPIGDSNGSEEGEIEFIHRISLDKEQAAQDLDIQYAVYQLANQVAIKLRVENISASDREKGDFYVSARKKGAGSVGGYLAWLVDPDQADRAPVETRDDTATLRYRNGKCVSLMITTGMSGESVGSVVGYTRQVSLEQAEKWLFDGYAYYSGCSICEPYNQLDLQKYDAVKLVYQMEYMIGAFRKAAVRAIPFYVFYYYHSEETEQVGKTIYAAVYVPAIQIKGYEEFMESYVIQHGTWRTTSSQDSNEP